MTHLKVAKTRVTVGYVRTLTKKNVAIGRDGRYVTEKYTV